MTRSRDRSTVDHNIEATESGHGLSDDRTAGLSIPDVGFKYDTTTAGALDQMQCLCRTIVIAIQDAYRGPLRCEQQRCRRANSDQLAAAAGAGDDRRAPLQANAGYRTIGRGEHCLNIEACSACATTTWFAHELIFRKQMKVWTKDAETRYP
jgi:hypothetical protein